jgi:hypothetical protein
MKMPFFEKKYFEILWGGVEVEWGRGGGRVGER